MQYAFLSAYFLAAFIFPLAFIATVWGAFHITDQRSKKVFWVGLILILGLLPILTDLRTPRGEFVDGVLRDVWVPPGIVRFLALWSTRGLTYLVLAFSLIVIVKAVYSKTIEKRSGGWLFAAYLTLAIPAFISSVAGTQPVFIHFLFYAPLIFTLTYLQQPTSDWRWYVEQFKRVLLVYIVLSAVFGLAAPSWTTGSALVLIPGLDFRLNGVFAHSNSLGMAALVYLVLDMAATGKRGLLGKVSWLISVSVLVVTQSKTAWAGAILAYVVFYAYKILTLRLSGSTQGLFPVFMSVLILLVGAAGLLLVAGPMLDSLTRSLDTQTYKSLTSFTGRTNLWEITVQSWKDNPLFGYGPALWDVEYRLKYAPQYLYVAGMAHNQFFQTLGESGILGVAGLFFYVIVLLRFGVRYFFETRGMSLALVLIFLVRAISETPFRNQTLDLMFFVHFALFVILLSLAVNEKKRQLLVTYNK